MTSTLTITNQDLEAPPAAAEAAAGQSMVVIMMTMIEMAGTLTPINGRNINCAVDHLDRRTCYYC